MPARAALVLVAAMSACQSDETISAYAGTDTVWQLEMLNGQPFAATATITFPETGRVAGDGPCNSFTGTQSAPYPWISFGPFASTKRMCPDHQAEAAFFAALQGMGFAEVSGPALILSNDLGGEMVFALQE